ncbi:MAG: PucR family transcriptional regulator ligand-binding domain-containing protein [Anaerolineaceae bacterium]|nr:PucR family transcriptional regulator ligand-binding domain-containing protein [Anaerolineaceae bacterium]
MSLTVNEILSEIPLFTDAKCITGHSHLNNLVNWSHIINDIDVIPWVRENDLLLTTAQGIYEDESAQKKFIMDIIHSGLSGVVISIGKYFQEVPVQMINIAEENNFPIITIPYEVKFVDVTHAIHEKILREKNNLTEKVFKIHDILTNLVVEGCGLEKFAESLANILNRSVTIEDPNLKILAYSLVGPTDEVRSRAIELGYTPTEVVNYLRKLGVFDKIKKDPKPQYLKPIPAMGIKFERIVAPILIGDQLFGYIWIIANGDSLTQLDYLAIERGAIVAALITSRDLAVYEAEQRGKSKIIDHLIDPESSELSLQSDEIIERLGMSGDFQILNIQNLYETITPAHSYIPILLDQIKKNGFQATIIERTKGLLLIFNTVDEKSTEQFLELLINYSKDANQKWIIGISQVTNSIEQFKRAFHEAVDSSRIGYAIGEEESSYWYYSKLGFLTWIMETSPEALKSNYYFKLVDSMNQYDNERNADIIKTLDVYFGTFSNAQETAKLLFIHRNTLRQRLKKIHEIWEVHLDDPFEMLNLYYAIKAYEIKRKRKNSFAN